MIFKEPQFKTEIHHAYQSDEFEHEESSLQITYFDPNATTPDSFELLTGSPESSLIHIGNIDN